MYNISGFDWIIIFAYLIGIILIGVFSGKKMHAYEDHILSGRNVTMKYLAPGLLTTQIGVAAIVTYVGLSYQQGISGGWWIATNVFTFIALGLIGAKQFRENVDAKTLPEWFGMRYDGKSRLFTSITTALSELAFVASQIIAGGTLFATLFGWQLWIGITVYAVVCFFYTSIGGMWAVFITDYIQMFVMFIGITAMILIGLNMAGGMEGLTAAAPDGYFDIVREGEGAATVAYILYAIPSIYCSFDVIQKLMCAKDIKTAQNSCYVAAIGVVFFAVCMPLLGVIGYVVLGPGLSADAVTPTIISEILPMGLKGLATAAVLATLMSSSSACLMAGSSVITNDILKYFVDFEHMEDKKKLRANIIVTACCGIVIWFVAVFVSSTIVVMKVAWTLLSCGAIVPLFAGLVWKKASSAGSIASMVVGSVVGFVWGMMGNPFGWEPVIPAYIVSIIVIVAVSLMFPDKDKKEMKEIPAA